MKSKFSCILILLFLASMFVVGFNFQQAKTHSSSQTETAQTLDPDWWPMFHHDLAHTGYSTSQAPTTNQTLWSYTTGWYVKSSPAVAGGMVYVGSGDDKVYALNAATGTLVWSYTTGNSVAYSSPAVAGGMVYVGSMDHKVYALNAATGTPIWSYTTGAYVYSSPAVAGGMVYVGSSDDKVYALNAATGTLVWNYMTGSYVWSSPAVAGGMVYVGSMDHKVYALNAATGTPIWSYRTGDYVYFASPAVAGGMVYVGSSDDKVYALNAATGTPIWNYTTGSTVDSCPAVAGDMVYVGSSDDKVYALNAATGTPIWNYTTGDPVGSSPAVAGGLVFVGSDDHKVYALNATTGTLVWSYTTGAEVWSSPAVAGGVVYVGSCHDEVYAFGVHDLAVVNVSPTQRVVLPGNGINVTVQVKNQGGYPETSNVTLYAGSTFLGIRVAALPNPGELATFVFCWNTTAFSPSYYFLKASIMPVSYESNLGNNIDVNGTVIIGVETLTGTNVKVSPAPNTQVTFTNTTTAGVTTLNVTQPPSTALTSASNSVFANIQTNATYYGNITLQFAFNPTGLTLEDKKAMRIWLWNASFSTWRDITTYVNTTTNTVYGVSPHLSCFAITCTLSITGYTSGQPVQTVLQTPSSPPGGLPPGLQALVYYDIQATAQWGEQFKLRLKYDPSTLSPHMDQFLQMWLWNQTLNQWVDITKEVDTVNNVLYGVSPHLSCFAITCLQLSTEEGGPSLSRNLER